MHISACALANHKSYAVRAPSSTPAAWCCTTSVYSAPVLISSTPQPVTFRVSAKLPHAAAEVSSLPTLSVYSPAKYRGVRRGRRVAVAVAVGMLCLSPPVLQHWIMYHAFRRVTRAVGKGPSFKILAVAKVDGRFERRV